MLELAQSIQKSDLVNTNNGLSDQVSHLFAAFGDQQYREADSILRTFIPKDYTLGTHSRRAAIWALGLIHDGELDEDLAAKLVDRLNDVVSLEPEEDVVRQMCAVSLGRMGAKSSLDDLRKYSGTLGFGSLGCAWAIEKMTGEKMPPMPPAGQNQIDGWFLSPIPAS